MRNAHEYASCFFLHSHAHTRTENTQHIYISSHFDLSSYIVTSCSCIAYTYEDTEYIIYNNKKLASKLRQTKKQAGI